MIIRIVKLSFDSDKTSDFLKLFNESKDHIKAFSGCIELNLYRDLDDPDVFFTYSVWASEKDLDYYRFSQFFKEIWPKTKACFSAPAEAWSLIDAVSN